MVLSVVVQLARRCASQCVAANLAAGPWYALRSAADIQSVTGTHGQLWLSQPVHASAASWFSSSTANSTAADEPRSAAGAGSSSSPTKAEASTQASTSADGVVDRDKSGDPIYESSKDDPFGVQKNWFSALAAQLNVVVKTGMLPHVKGHQKEIFEAVETEFESLYRKHVRGKGLEGNAHRGLMMCCLAAATHKVLSYELGDEAVVREVIHTNLGGVAVKWMSHLHKMRTWILTKLLAEEPFTQAVSFLPNIKSDMGVLVASEVEMAGTASSAPAVRHGPTDAAATTPSSTPHSQPHPAATGACPASPASGTSVGEADVNLPEHLLPPEERTAAAAASGGGAGAASTRGGGGPGSDEAVWRITSCAFSDLLHAEGCPELLREFCCQYSMQWLSTYERYGLRIGQTQCKAFGDTCCEVRINKMTP